MDLVGLMKMDEMLVESAKRKYTIASDSYASLINFRKEIGMSCGKEETSENLASEISREEYEKLLVEGYEALGLILIDMLSVFKVCKEYSCCDAQKQVLLALALYRRKVGGKS